MKKFMALYMAPVEMFEQWMKTPPEEQKEGMENWTKWMKSNAKFFVDEGAPLGKTKRVSANGVSDTKNEIGGYSIVQAESADEAAKIIKSSPHLSMEGTWVELIECAPMQNA